MHMMNDYMAAPAPLDSLRGKTITMVPKRPWERRYDRFAPRAVFRNYVGTPIDDPMFDKLQTATEEALLKVELVAQFVTHMASLADYLAHIASVEGGADAAVACMDDAQRVLRASKNNPSHASSSCT